MDEKARIPTFEDVGVRWIGWSNFQCEGQRTCPFDNGWQATCGATAVSGHGNRTGVSNRVFHVIVATGGRSLWLSSVQSSGRI